MNKEAQEKLLQFKYDDEVGNGKADNAAAWEALDLAAANMKDIRNLEGRELIEIMDAIQVAANVIQDHVFEAAKPKPWNSETYNIDVDL